MGAGDSYLSIFLLEDNPSDVFLVCKAMDNAGIQYQLRLAEDGEAALSFLEEVERSGKAVPDVVLLDLNVPRKSGDVVLGHLRNYARWRRIPVVVITSSCSEADRAGVMRLGASAYFVKPANLRDFLELGSVVRQVRDSAPAA